MMRLETRELRITERRAVMQRIDRRYHRLLRFRPAGRISPAMHGGADLFLGELCSLSERRDMHAPFIFTSVERAGAIDDDLALSHRQRSLVEHAAGAEFLPGPRLRRHDAEQEQRRRAAHDAIELFLDLWRIGRRQRREA